MMKRSDVKIGGVYIAKVTNKLVEVRIDAVSKYGGWTATNLVSNRPIRIRSATRLRGEAGQQGKTNSKNNKRDSKTVPTTDADKLSQSTAQTVATTSEIQTKSEALPTTCPNCGGAEFDEDGDCSKCHEPKVTENVAKDNKTTKPHPKKNKPSKPKRLSGLDAAAKVLEETGVPMNVKEIVEAAFAKGYWKPAGRTPSATLSAALIREIAKKGEQSRFRKSERGKFVLNR